MEKTCPVCGKKFVCSHASNCWCSRLKIGEKIANYLKNNYNDCLCEDCITKIIEEFK